MRDANSFHPDNVHSDTVIPLEGKIILGTNQFLIANKPNLHRRLIMEHVNRSPSKSVTRCEIRRGSLVSVSHLSVTVSYIHEYYPLQCCIYIDVILYSIVQT